MASPFSHDEAQVWDVKFDAVEAAHTASWQCGHPAVQQHTQWHHGLQR